MIILGLDISTSITGYCLMDTDAAPGHRLLQVEGIIISHEKDAYRKSVIVRDTFKDILEHHKVELIVVEENLQAFRRGLSSARTLSTLARFNGIVSFLAQDTFQVPLQMINVNTARKKAGLEIDRKSDVPIKEQIRVWVSEQADFQEYTWPMKTLKSGPRKGQTVCDKRCFDIADAAVICLAEMSIEQ
jgi:Holliday junction resolvasome RuvABC endonuclease subunit